MARNIVRRIGLLATAFFFPNIPIISATAIRSPTHHDTRNSNSIDSIDVGPLPGQCQEYFPKLQCFDNYYQTPDQNITARDIVFLAHDLRNAIYGAQQSGGPSTGKIVQRSDSAVLIADTASTPNTVDRIPIWVYRAANNSLPSCDMVDLYPSLEPVGTIRARILFPQRYTSYMVLLDDIATTIDGGRPIDGLSTPESVANSILSCGTHGGQMNVRPNMSNPAYKTDDYKQRGAQPDGVMVMVYHK